MRRIGNVTATLVIAAWLFIIGFMLGYLGTGASATVETATAAGLFAGAAALVFVAVAYLAVRIVRATTHHGHGSHHAKHAG